MIPPLPTLRFSVAPMMDWTDRYCRLVHRLMSRHALLYTEMVTAQAVIRGDRERLIGFDALEHPVALQLGGNDPRLLAEAARIGADFGYDEIDLNCGCPSDRVQGGAFGACLMREPALVGDCVAAMKAAVCVPVTVKCRIGVDDQDPEAALDAMAAALTAAGVDALIVHARKAWLQGLSPKQNREVPPLDYDRAYRLKAANPGLNGVFATATLVGEAAGAVAKNEGLEDIFFIAFDASPQEADLVRDGALDALVVQQPRLMGELSIEAAIAALEGAEFTGEPVVDFVTITADNIEDPEFSKLIYSTECSAG